MKKFYTQFKLYFVAVLLLAFAGKANAEVTIDDIAGTYKFTADFSIQDNDYADVLPSEFTFTIANNSGLQITGFIVESQSCYAKISDGQITLNSQAVGDPNSAILNISNINGDYPNDWTNPIFPTWNVDDDGNITIPDFTVVESNYRESTATIVAKYTNCVVTKQAEEPAPAVSFAGTYTVTGTKYDYTAGMPPTSSNESFTLSIDEEGNVYEIAGYEVPEVYGAQGVYGKISENSFVISPVTNSYLTIGAVYDKLGGNNAYEYDTDASITLSYADGAWTITDFSVWESAWADGGFTYTLKYYWTGLTVAKEDGDEPTPDPEPAVSVAGTYTVSGTQYYYNTDADVVSAETSFTLSIDEEGNVYEIAGYEVPEVYGAQGVYGKISGNSFVISPVGNSSLSLGMVFDKLGGNNPYEYDADASITLNYADGAWTMTDFSVWQFDWSTSEYTLKYYWTNLTVTKEDGAGDEEPEPYIAWVYTAGYGAYSYAFESDPIVQALKKDYTVVEMSIDADTNPTENEELNNTLLNADVVICCEAMTGNKTMSNSLVKYVGQVPMVALKAYNYNDGRWNWGTPANPTPAALSFTANAKYKVLDGVTYEEDGTIKVATETASNAIQAVTFGAGAPADMVIMGTVSEGAAMYASNAQKFFGLGLSSDCWNYYTENAGIIVKNAAAMLIAGEDLTDAQVDGINAINAEAENGAIYNLQGQKVEKAQKGLYIINGKKVVMK